MGEIPIKNSEQRDEEWREKEGEIYNLSMCTAKIVSPPSTRSATLSCLSLSKFTCTCLTRGGRPAILEKYRPMVNYNLRVIYGFNLRSSRFNECFGITSSRSGFH